VAASVSFPPAISAFVAKDRGDIIRASPFRPTPAAAALALDFGAKSTAIDQMKATGSSGRSRLVDPNRVPVAQNVAGCGVG
jgi:hypothetical protein